MGQSQTFYVQGTIRKSCAVFQVTSSTTWHYIFRF